MTIGQLFLAELEHEAASTRKVLAAIPEDKFGWKPHEKSMTLGRLATHIVEIISWNGFVLQTSELDFAKDKYVPREFTSIAELLAEYDKNVEQAKKDLAAATDAQMYETWTMRSGDQIYFTLPKAACLRTWAFSHLFHHRGQMSVYLRLLNVPVPGVYGPSADEM